MEAQLKNINAHNSYLWSSLIATSIVFVVTAFHHFYGAAVYNTPWRRDVGVNGGVTLLVCFIFLYLYKRYKKKIFLTLYSIISFLLFGLLIGLFEGFYNHVMKNILYFSGMNIHTFRMLFPDPPYELPENFIFESTGVLQFFVALVSCYYLVKVNKKKKKDNNVITPVNNFNQPSHLKA
jgi:hypothetical protein